MFGPDGTVLASAGCDGKLRLGRSIPGNLLKAVMRYRGPFSYRQEWSADVQSEPFQQV